MTWARFPWRVRIRPHPHPHPSPTTFAAVGMVSGVSSVLGTSSGTAASVGLVSGVATVLGVGGQGAAKGFSSGTASVLGSFGFTASSVGLATVLGTGTGLQVGTGAATGSASVLGVGVAKDQGIGVSSGSATVLGVEGFNPIQGVGASAGLATVSGVGKANSPAVGSAIGSATVLGTDSLMGTANIQFSPLDTSPARITTPDSLVISSGGSLTATYCIIGATSAWLFNRETGTQIALVVDGAQHTITYSPTLSGDFPMVAQDANGGQVVQPLPFIIQESLPPLDPTAAPTKTSTANGAWASGSTWVGGVAPGRDDIVSVLHTVTCSGRNNFGGRGIVGNGGVLDVAGGGLHITDVDVLNGGTYKMDSTGASASPRAFALFRNRPFSVNDTAGNSPDGQPNFWNALYIRSGGSFITRGPQPTPYSRCAKTVTAGQTNIPLKTKVVNWQVGDKLLVTDSRQYTNADLSANLAAGHPVRKYDIAVVRGVSPDGLTVYLLNPLVYDHPCAHDLDGNEIDDLRPDVVNLYRQTIILSSDPTTVATRVHIQATGAAIVDCQNYNFHGTGRTTNANVNGSHDANGHLVTNTNYNGRHPFFANNLYGPSTPLSYGDQWHLENGVIMDPVSPNNVTFPINEPQVDWPLSVNNSYYGTFLNNVCFNWAGSGVFWKDQISSYNKINGNFVAVVTGNGDRFGNGSTVAGQPDNGQHGMGIEICSPFNQCNNNICNSITNGGVGLCVGLTLITFPFAPAGNLGGPIPAFQGANPAVNGVMVDMRNVPFGISQTGIGDFDGNESYGCTDMGYEYWLINSAGLDSANPPFGGGTSNIVTYFSDTNIWHVHHQVSFPYHANHVTNLRLRAYGELFNLQQQSGGQGYPSGIFYADYLSNDNVFDQCHFEGYTFVLYPSVVGTGCNTCDPQRTATVSNSYIRCLNTLVLGDRWTSGGSLYNLFGPRLSTLDSNTYVAPGHGLSYSIVQLKQGDQGSNANRVATDVCILKNYNGHDYKLYWLEQAADSMASTTGYVSNNPLNSAPIGCPDAMLTNQQMWDKYTAPFANLGILQGDGRYVGQHDQGTGFSQLKPRVLSFGTPFGRRMTSGLEAPYMVPHDLAPGLATKGDLVPGGTVTLPLMVGSDLVTLVPCLQTS